MGNFFIPLEYPVYKILQAGEFLVLDYTSQRSDAGFTEFGRIFCNGNSIPMVTKKVDKKNADHILRANGDR